MKDNKTNLVLIALTGVSALIAVALVYFYVENRISLEKENFTTMAQHVDPANPSPNMTQVVICKTDIKQGEPLSAENLTVINVNTDAVQDIEVLSSINGVIGLKLNQTLYAGEWLLKAKVSPDNTTNCKLFIAEDSRAIRVMLNATHGLLGLVEPGDRVDVIAVLPGKKSKQISRTILQDIAVLSVGNRCEPATTNAEAGQTPQQASPTKTFLTLEVDANQATKLALAMDTGTIHLTLKNKGDQPLTFCKTFDLDNLVTTKSRPRPKKANKKSAQYTLTIINGDKIYKE
ncbi:MAG: Flp pilus assembly protein CpaB [Spirochaetales bacterium]|nr:Flp pilus assembly protein CpaB [Spirochaetales bacterium]